MPMTPRVSPIAPPTLPKHLSLQVVKKSEPFALHNDSAGLMSEPWLMPLISDAFSPLTNQSINRNWGTLRVKIDD
jgi:hypothetical protein